MSKADLAFAPDPSVVSVVIPVHNRCDLAREALKTVLAQEYRPIQIIVSDDGSEPPFTADDFLADEQLTLEVVRQNHNQGPGAAREAGRVRATGQYIAYLDSDDKWEPSFLPKLVGALEGAPEAGMAYCITLEVRKDGYSTVRRRSDLAHSGIFPALLWGRPWHTSSCLWRKSLSDRIGAWAPLFWWEDYVHDARAGALGVQLLHVPEPLCRIEWEAEGMISRPRDESALRRGISSRAAALKEISASLEQSSWAMDRSSRGRMGVLCLKVAGSASELGLWIEARASMELGKRWIDGGLVNDLISAVAGAAMAVKNRSFSSRAIRKIQKIVARENTHDGESVSKYEGGGSPAENDASA